MRPLLALFVYNLVFLNFIRALSFYDSKRSVREVSYKKLQSGSQRPVFRVFFFYNSAEIALYCHALFFKICSHHFHDFEVKLK